MEHLRPYRVLTLDGGGMRGSYMATYLDSVAELFATKRGVEAVDLGAAFDLIVGTSTGGIVACALASGMPLKKVVELYQKHGAEIFQRKLPAKPGLGLFFDHWLRPGALARGDDVLRQVLHDTFGDETIGEVYSRRHIGLAITAVEMSRHRSWVFKTPHLANTNHRDDSTTLVDVCLATSAAPIYRSMTMIKRSDGHGENVFVDGGLWANNPVLVGLIDALEAPASEREIQIFSLGTYPEPAGEHIEAKCLHRGLGPWKFGGEAAALSIDAQQFAFDQMARMLVKHLKRKCSLVRFPNDPVPAALMPFLGLDETRPEAIAALICQARGDIDMLNSRCNDKNSVDGQLILELGEGAPVKSASKDAGSAVSVGRE